MMSLPLHGRVTVNPQMLMGKRVPPYQILKVLADGGNDISMVNWAGIGDGLTPVVSTLYPVRGLYCIDLGVDASLDAGDLAGWIDFTGWGDLSAYQHDWVYAWLYLSGPVLLLLNTWLQLMFGVGDFSKYIYKNFDPATFTAGWNILKFDLDNPSGSGGSFNFSSTEFCRILLDEQASATTDFDVYLGYLAFVRPLT